MLCSASSFGAESNAPERSPRFWATTATFELENGHILLTGVESKRTLEAVTALLFLNIDT